MRSRSGAAKIGYAFAPRPFDLSDYLARISADLRHAIRTVAIVEEWLEALLLQQHRRVQVARHFGDYGPLNSFGKKITKAHDLLLIDEDTRRDLDVLKEVRNAFATQRGISTSTAVPWRGC